MRRTLFAGVALLAMASLSFGDTLIMRNGTTRNGRFVSGSRDTIVFQEDGGSRRTYNRNDIQSIQFTGSVNTGLNTGSRSDSNWGYRTDNAQSASSAPVNTAAGERSIPAGTDLVIRTNEEIQGTENIEGRTFNAQVDRDVVGPSGTVIIPRGSDAELVVRSVDKGGAVGSRDMVLDLQSVRVSGQRYLVSSEDVRQSDNQGIGKNSRTAKMVGGGALLGTVLGAIAGGGKGAAIGAVAGAAAGAGAQVLTRGKEIRVPAESTLTFRLDQPLRLVPQR